MKPEPQKRQKWEKSLQRRRWQMMRLKAKYLAVFWVSVYRSLIITTTSYLKQRLKIMLRHATQEQYNKTKTEQNKNKLELHWCLRPMWTQIFGDVKIWYTGKYFFLSVTQNKTRFPTIRYEQLFMCSFFLIIQQQVTDYSIILCPIVLWSAGCFICVLSTFFFFCCFFFLHFIYWPF